MPKTATNGKINWSIFFNGGTLSIAFISIAIGVIGFLTVVGPRAIYPSNIAWLGHGDPATHYLGWLFFRKSEWSFPIGLNPTYGLEISNGIIFSDSNPLLAILFKPLSWLLPDTFQYFGLWLVVCFVLQAFFAYRLINLFTKSPVLCSLGACFFVFAPPMLLRLYWHLSLVGHFLVVASLYLSLATAPKHRTIGWVALLVVSALTHAYLLAMVGLIWAADVSGRVVKNALPLPRMVFEIVIVFVATLFACWQAGYFSVGEGAISSGFGYYRMHPLSIFDPSGWSYVLRDIPEAPGTGEGFNYLGLGIIFLGVCSLPSVINGQTELVRSIQKKPILFVALLGLTVFALSNKLGIQTLWVEFELPDYFMRTANIFRASGRMFWPAFYMLYFVVIFSIVRGYSKRVAITLLGAGLIIQIADTSATWLDIRAKLMTAPSSAWQTKMADSFWNDAATKYSKVRFFSLGNQPETWQEISNYAGTHGLATDAVYLARVGNLAVEIAQQKVKSTLQNGTFDSDSLYILGDNNLRQTAIILDGQRDLLAQINGFTVVAPGWKKCSTCPEVSGEVNISDHLPSPLRLGDRLVFSQYQSGLRYLGGGWSHPEHWGTWSDGSHAMIILTLESGQGSTIMVEANPLLSPSRSEQTVEVEMNGLATSSVTLTANSGGRFDVAIPEEVKEQLRQNPILRLQLRFPDAARPVDIGINNDERKLAIGLVALTVK